MSTHYSRMHSATTVNEKKTYWVQNFKHEVRYVGKIVKSTKIAYTWEFDVRSNVDTNTKGAKAVKQWKHVEVNVFDSLLTKKKTIIVNGKELVSKQVW